MPTAAERVVAVDTSVAVPLLVRTHGAHEAMAVWRAARKLRVCGHAWLETYSVLTRLPGTARLSPPDATRMLTTNFLQPCAARPETFARAVDLFAAAGIAGGATYDGWVALAALDTGALLVSRDERAEGTYRRLGADVEMVT